MEYIYVDTVSTGGSQDGSTRTHGSSGTAAFESLFAAEAWLDTDRASLSDDLTVKLAGEEDGTAVVWDCFGSDATYTLVIMGDDGADDSADGGDDGTSYNDNGRYTGNLDWSEDHYSLIDDVGSSGVFATALDVTLKGFMIRNTSTSTSYHYCAYYSTDTPALVDGMRLWNENATSGCHGIRIQQLDTSETTTIQNCLAIVDGRGTSWGFSFRSIATWTGTATLKNCTSTSATNGGSGFATTEVAGTAGTHIVANNCFFNFSDDISEGGAGNTYTYSYNATDDADEGGNAITMGTATDQLVDPTGSIPGDFDMTPLRTGVLSRAADSTYSTTLDLNGSTRHSSQADVGAVEREIGTDYVYVDTNSAGGAVDGSTRVEGTGATNAHETLFAAEAQIDIDYPSGLVDHLTVKCAGTSIDTANVIWNAPGSTAAYILTIMGDDGADDSAAGGDNGTAFDSDGKYDGPLDWSTSHYRMENNGSAALGFYASAAIISGLQVRNTKTDAARSAIRLFAPTPADPTGVMSIDSCRVHTAPYSSATYGIYIDTASRLSSGYIVQVSNCIVVTPSSSSGRCLYLTQKDGWDGVCNFIHNTVIGNTALTTYGIQAHAAGTGSGTKTVANNAVVDCNDDITISDTGFGSTTYANNASNDADEGGGALTITTSTDEWEDPTGTDIGDFDLTPLKGSVLTRAGNASYAQTTDIDGATRNPTYPDVGAVERPVSTEYLYVDTNSAGGSVDGSTRVEGSAATDAHESMFAAEAWVDLDRAALTDNLTVKCAGTTVDSASVSWDALGSTAYYTLTVMGDDGADDSASDGDDGAAYDDDGKYDGPLDWSTSHYRLDVTGATSFTTTKPMDFIGLQVTRSDAASNGTSAYFLISTSGDVTVDSCRFWCGAGGSQKPFYFRPTNQSSTTWTVQNCINANPAGSNSSCLLLVTASSNTMTVNAHNNTLIGADSGTTLSRGVWLSGDGTGSTISVRNNVILGGPTQDLDDDLTGTPTTTIDNNASASGVGTNAITITTETDEVVDPTGTAPGDFDFTPLKGSGITRAGDGTYAPTLDINGATRNPTFPDVGAQERSVATEYLYVDTNSAGGSVDGSTRVEGSAATDAHESLFAAEAWVDLDRTALTDNLTVKCAGTTVDNTFVAWDALGSTAYYTLTIMGDDGADDSASDGDDGTAYDNDGKYDGPLDWSTSHYRMEVAGNDCLYFSITDGVIVDGLQLQVTGTTGTQLPLYFIISSAPSYAANFTVKNCRMWGSEASANPMAFRVASLRGTETLTVENNIFITRGSGNARGISADSISGASGDITIRHNTCYSTNTTNSIGVYLNLVSGSSNNAFLYNNAVGSQTNDMFLNENGTGTITVDYNATDDADGTNAITLGTPTDEWVDPTGTAPGNFDFNPAAGSQLIEAANVAYSPTLDINGLTRDVSTPDIGAIEYVAAGGGGGGGGGSYYILIRRRRLQHRGK